MEAFKLFWIILGYCYLAISIDAARFPKHQLKADDRTEDDDVSDFLLELAENFKYMMKSGIKAAGIPPLDPLIVDQDTDMELGKGNSKFSIFIAKGFKVEGLTDFEILSLKARTKQLYVNASVVIPKVLAQGTYKVDGKILFVPITGDGDFFADVEGIHSQLSVDLVEVDGHYQTTNFHLDFGWDKLLVNLENIIDPNLSPVINKIINGMGTKVYQRFKPVIMTMMNQLLPPIFNNILGKYTIEEIKSGKFIPMKR